MSGAALREHLRLLADLGKIVGAMRNLAYAEVQRLSRMMTAQAQAEQVLLQAMADCLPENEESEKQAIWLMIGSERGFCGGFNDHVLEAWPALAARYPDAIWYTAGERLCQRAVSLIPKAGALLGCSTAEEAAECVESWIESLLPITNASPDAALLVLHHTEHGLYEGQILPQPKLPAPCKGSAPLRTLATHILQSRLQAEWLRTSLTGALYQSLQQENRWRLAQMQRAQDHLDEASAHLKQAYFRQRQADITSELETLMSSLDVTVAGSFSRNDIRGKSP